VVRDVCSQSLGIIAYEDEMCRAEFNSVIIPYNSKIPHKCSQPYRTMDDNQTELKIEVTEGDDRDVTVVGRAY
jgi:molecular chaperone DnaK